MSTKRERLLRLAFWAGAITDAVALIPMLFPPAASRMWGLAAPTPAGWYALGSGASLMLGWTGLLAWAAQRPGERAFVAPLTVLVVGGIVATEVVCLLSGAVQIERMAPTLALQALLLGCFGTSYHWRAEAVARGAS